MKSKLMTTRKLLLGGLLVILVLSSIPYFHVSANGDDDEDGDGIDDNFENENKREVNVEHSSEEVQISSSSSNNEVQNEFQIQVKVGSDGLVLKLDYEGNNNDEESEIEFEVSFTEIIEYTDTTGEGAFNDSEIVQQTLALEDFKPIDYSTDTIDNTSVYVLGVETVDGIFTSTLYISTEFVNISGVIVAPTQMKIDIGIHNFPFAENDTQLALQVQINSDREIDYEDQEETEDEDYGFAEDEHEIAVKLNDYTGFFSWAETAVIDDVVYNVTESIPEGGSEEQIMYLNYPRGAEIIHDPKIGIEGILIDIDHTIPSTILIPWVHLVNPTQTEFLIVTVISLIIVICLVLIFRQNKHIQV